MPKMKYFQTLADIRNVYDDTLRRFEDEDKISQLYLELQGLTKEDKSLLLEEREVLHYLLACQNGISYGDENVTKPNIEVVNRCFNRHLERIEDVFGVTSANVNKFGNPSIKKQYKACRHYLFKFSLKGWVNGMPDVILSYDNKYPKNK